jgi:hypothetical protein
VKAAETAVLSAEKALDSTKRDANRQRQETTLERARERLKKAVEAEDAAKKRSELIFKFGFVNNPFTQSKQQAEKHQILLQWILDQVPLIEAEIAEAKADAPSGQKRTRADSDELESEEPAAKKHTPGTPTAQEVQPEPNPFPEPPARSSTRPSQKRAREDDGEDEPKMTDTKRHKPDAPAKQEPRQCQKLGLHTQNVLKGQNHEAPGSEPRPKQTQASNNKATARCRQPQFENNSPEQSADPPPARRSERLAALQKRAPTAVNEATAPQATTTSSSKPTPATGNRKRVEEEEPP